jgi:hypothetical protein
MWVRIRLEKTGAFALGFLQMKGIMVRDQLGAREITRTPTLLRVQEATLLALLT